MSASENSQTNYSDIPFGFQARIRFQATRQLQQVKRDANIAHLRRQQFESERYGNIWNKPPPDFSYPLYASKSFRNTSKSNRKDSPKQSSSSTFVKKHLDDHLPTVVKTGRKEPRFVISHHLSSSFQAKIDHARREYPNHPEFTDPKPHEFRKLADIKKLGLNRFATAYEHDPGGLHIKSEGVYKLYEDYDNSRPAKTSRTFDSSKNFCFTFPNRTKWDPKLILKQDPYYPSFSAHGAFLDRVARRLNTN
ncbi:hypothetical protein TrispH2_007498 [Trichoplax sp. H2]|uniref:Uncharacterized protein n=1 Tax=Trichoplax adhaerens TaxID=10228 RepID=B3RTA9_TRIAD|nr:hypothetical protein TRIADDRAFT_54898 [Trichoplax adhaerens]EDV27196.1 hypothetical protein TRIADDRAFT_54898 [Trichoplax adhaerens]RDD40929.1 hypothetical protein TrispH2_007498 [Trichoplax sp. H2]|eukprot:XP_002111192.1 hypothetical protein TRIADDRAFT_54898 [Trichoplax adhaerens]